MGDIQQDIRAWLRQRPDWLQQAAEILLSSGSASDSDIQNLVNQLKNADKQQRTSHRTFEALTPTPAPGGALRLVSIGDIQGIENLGPRSPLSFGNENLCVIYGHNGSGKSGYVRLLKKACGKPRATELESNVFQRAPEVRACRITYSLDGVQKEVEWRANAAPVADIRPADIFDADAALFYLKEETTAAYTPPSVALFEALAAVCDRIKGRLQAEQEQLTNSLPKLPQEYSGTRVAIAYRALKPNLAEEQILSLIQWGEAEQKKMDELTGRLRTDDPAALASKKRNTKTQVDQLANLSKKAAIAFGQGSVATIQAFRDGALAMRRIARESAKVSGGRLEGVGSDTWQALWEAARKYSQTAYPDSQFPVTTDGARCVLCHQDLGPVAQERLRGFEAFVQGELESQAREAEARYQKALEELPTALTDEEVRTQCQAAGLTDESFGESLKGLWRQIGKVREALISSEANGPATPVAAPMGLLERLAGEAETLESQALQHDADAKNFDRAQARAEKLNLEAQRWTAQQSAAIRAEIARLNQGKAYERWKGAANSREISIKAGQISEQAITQSFVDRFNRELQALGASRIKVELTKSRMAKGKALHRLRLRGIRNGQHPPESILSDGERRIVGLAAFLADVAEQPHAAPFIFDDPISSLDQDFELFVATRLAKLAQNRQVLVFTHRLSLYGAMEDAARKVGEEWKKEHLQQQCIESFDGVAGHPAEEATWNANTTKANNILLDRLAKAKKASEKAKEAGEGSWSDAYKSLAQGICSDFRKLLERTVEDDLLNQVVRRHRRSVTTDNRLGSLPNITKEDCKLIDDLMSKYSLYEHSQSQETPISIPEESELRGDLEALQAWRAEFKKRPVESLAHA